MMKSSSSDGPRAAAQRVLVVGDPHAWLVRSASWSGRERCSSSWRDFALSCCWAGGVLPDEGNGSSIGSSWRSEGYPRARAARARADGRKTGAAATARRPAGFQGARNAASSSARVTSSATLHSIAASSTRGLRASTPRVVAQMGAHAQPVGRVERRIAGDHVRIEPQVDRATPVARACVGRHAHPTPGRSAARTRRPCTTTVDSDGNRSRAISSSAMRCERSGVTLIVGRRPAAA